MPSAAVWVKTDGAQKYRALSRRLRGAGRRDLQRKLTRSIRAEGGPALSAVQAAWLTVDVKSLAPNDRGGTARPNTSTGLRQRVARATRIQVLQSGIRISVNGRRVDPKYPSLVFYLNSFPRKRDWRHKVFNQRRKRDNSFVWVAQRGQEVFYPTLREFTPAWRAGIKRAMEETAAEIER
jgi:hypothetical protein